MKAAHLYLWLHVLATASALANAFDPVTTTVVVSVGAALGRTIYDYFHESCDQKWISFNATGEHVQQVDVQTEELVFNATKGTNLCSVNYSQ